jgi:hypothetical protein
LYERCKVDQKMDFVAFKAQKQAHGDGLIKAKQFEAAMKGDKTMLVWLGKQRLNQSDKSQTEVTGADGGPVQNKVTVEIIEPE